MGILGFVFKAAKYFGLLVVMAFLSLLCALIPTMLLRLNPIIPEAMKTLGNYGAVACMFVGWAAVYSSHDPRYLKWAFLASFAPPGGALVLSIPPAIATIYATNPILAGVIVLLFTVGAYFAINAARGIYGSLHDISERIASEISSKFRKYEPIPVAAIEITQMPEGHLARSESEIDRSSLIGPIHCILRSMILEGSPVGFSISNSAGRTRYFFLTFGADIDTVSKRSERLLSFLGNNLPEFSCQLLNAYPIFGDVDSIKGCTSTITGEPLSHENSAQRIDILTPVTEALLSISNGILQFYAVPAKTGFLERMIRRMEYTRAAEKARISQSTSVSGLFAGPHQDTATIIDPVESNKAARLGREIRRMNAGHSCRVYLNIASWSSNQETAEWNTEQLALSLAGAIMPADDESDIRIHRSRSELSLRRVLDGTPTGPATHLSTMEASLFMIPPRCEVGIETSKRQMFSTVTHPLPADEQKPVEVEDKKPVPRGRKIYTEWKLPSRIGAILLGNPMRYGSPNRNVIEWFDPQKFESHFLLTGNPRAGKTTTGLTLAAQASRCGIRTMIITPQRVRHLLPLMYVNPRIWVFTAGRNIVPFRVNLFNPVPGVTVGQWMKAVVWFITRSFPNDEVLDIHFDDVVHTMYRKKGWDPKKNIKGQPIMLSDLWDAMLEVLDDLQYGNDVSRNFYGAIYARITSMMRNHSLVDMLNTPEGVSFELLVNNDVIIDLEGLVDENDRALIMSYLTIGMHMYKKANPTEHVSNLLVLEEASYVLQGSSKSIKYGPTTLELIVKTLEDMFTTSGGNGLGIVAIEQLISRIIPAIRKLIVNVITHAVSDGEERDLIQSKLGITDAQSEHILRMGKGETVVFIEGMTEAKNIQVWQLNDLLEVPIPTQPVTEEMVLQAMCPILEENPAMFATEPLPDEIISRIHRTKSASPEEIALAKKGNAKPAEEEWRLKVDPVISNDLQDAARNERFLKVCRNRLDLAKRGDFKPIAEAIMGVANKLADGRMDIKSSSRVLHFYTMKDLNVP
ncbi:MAG: hypothetical protein ACFFFC_14345, partial [Candidatus Thorarchaeota archaeon]